jgi:prepilin-type N-terminal cleavage/methylation domain-containing protein/prepilin-type processing-associated H-X9-DG protein
MRQDCFHQRRHAFTLVELLVVVGIISVLIGLLMPVLGKVRKHAQEVHCAANLHSIGQALTMYTQQYGFYPGWSAGPVAVWPPRLRAFLGGNSRVFFCPAQDDRCEWRMLGPAPGGVAIATQTGWGYVQGEPLIHIFNTYFSYGYNAYGTGGNDDVLFGGGNPHLGLGEQVNTDPAGRGIHRELRSSRVKMPEEMIAVADSTVDGLFDSSIIPRKIIGQLPGSQAPGVVHRGGDNVLFCDGHVQWYLQRDLIVTDDGSPADAARRRMWNNDHQPH